MSLSNKLKFVQPIALKNVYVPHPPIIKVHRLCKMHCLHKIINKKAQKYQKCNFQECSEETRLCWLFVDDVRAWRRLSWRLLHCQHQDVSLCTRSSWTYCECCAVAKFSWRRNVENFHFFNQNKQTLLDILYFSERASHPTIKLFKVKKESGICWLVCWQFVFLAVFEYILNTFVCVVISI